MDVRNKDGEGTNIEWVQHKGETMNGLLLRLQISFRVLLAPLGFDAMQPHPAIDVKALVRLLDAHVARDTLSGALEILQTYVLRR